MNNYPTRFGSEIESKDTNVFPVLLFGSFFDWMSFDFNENTFYNENPSADPFRDFLLLSTTNCRLGLRATASQEPIATDACPLILNMSSMKESIDLKKRSHKISNISITISNDNYKGNNFSNAISQMQSFG